MKSLITFLRRLPAFLDACNELADVNDIWRYGMDASRARKDRMDADRDLRRSIEHRESARAIERRMIDPIKECLAFHQYGSDYHRIYPSVSFSPEEDPSDLHLSFRSSVTLRHGQRLVACIDVAPDTFDRARKSDFVNIVAQGLAEHMAENLKFDR